MPHTFTNLHATYINVDGVRCQIASTRYMKKVNSLFNGCICVRSITDLDRGIVAERGNLCQSQ